MLEVFDRAEGASASAEPLLEIGVPFSRELAALFGLSDSAGTLVKVARRRAGVANGHRGENLRQRVLFGVLLQPNYLITY